MPGIPSLHAPRLPPAARFLLFHDFCGASRACTGRCVDPGKGGLAHGRVHTRGVHFAYRGGRAARRKVLPVAFFLVPVRVIDKRHPAAGDNVSIGADSSAQSFCE